jgi:ubiquitin C-terminal hydrolase
MSTPEKESKIENSEKRRLKRKRDDSPSDLRHSDRKNSFPSDEECGNKRAKTDVDLTEKNLTEILVKNGLESNSINSLTNKIKNSNGEKIECREILETLTSQIFKSNFKNTFLNAIWKLQVPKKDFDGSFRKTEILDARPGVPCELMIDFSERSEEFTLLMRLGEGETLEKEFETDRILDGSNQELLEKMSIEGQGVCEGEKSLKENQNQVVISTPMQNSQQEHTQVFSAISTPIHNNDDSVGLEPSNSSEITIKNLDITFGPGENEDLITKKKIEELKTSEKVKRDTQAQAQAELVYFNLMPKQEHQTLTLNDLNKKNINLKSLFDNTNHREINLNLDQENQKKFDKENNLCDPGFSIHKEETKQTEENKININMKQFCENSPLLEIDENSNPIASNKISSQLIPNGISEPLKCLPQPLPQAISDIHMQNLESDLGEWFNTKIDVHLLNYKWENFTKTKVTPGEIITHTFKISKEAFLKATNDQDTQTIIIDISVIKMNTKKTGYLGLVNEGMTCYMNSMLQTLNIFGYFKSAVFKIPRNISEEFSTNCVAYSLQKIFFELMTESKPISTLGLVKSFGWGKEQLLIQHDVQEFNLKLSDIMEAKMKGTEVEGTFKYLFEGRALNYIQCVNVDYKSLKEENFNDLQLTVKGCHDIYESFDKYTEEEILDKENMYEAEGYGKQIAKKGIKFMKLPNVLILQLKRFEYNFSLDRMEKVNDYFEFYEKINLAKYLVEEPGSDTESTHHHRQEENNFSLHSVMVHSGSANAGHYFAFIKPYIDSPWIKFNDENVKFSDDYEVFSNNFGGISKIYKHFNRDEISEHEHKSDSNAYILVYIKDQERKNILKPFTIEDVPINFIKSFEHDKNEEKRMMLLNLRQSNNFNIHLFSKEVLVGRNNLGILNPPSVEGFNSQESIKNKMVLNLPKNLKISDFINFLSEISSIPRERIQLFKYVYLYPLNILKKNIYKMVYIEEKFHVKCMQDILEIKPCKMCLVYIHINNEIEKNQVSVKMYENINYSIFKLNEHFDPQRKNNRNLRPPEEEEYIINEEKNQVIYFNKKENFWRFNQDNENKINHLKFINPNSELKSPYENIDTLNSSDFNKEIEIADEFCLIVLKFLTFDPNNPENKCSIIVDDVIALRKNSTLSSLKEKINFQEKYKQYLDPSFVDLIPDYNLTMVNFYIEFTSIEEINNYAEIKKLERKIFLSSSDLTVSNFHNDAACLIVNLKWKDKIKYDNKEILDLQPLIQEAVREIHNIVNLPFIFIQDRKRDSTIDFLKGKKMKLKVDWNEQDIKEFLHKEILDNLDCLDEMLDLKGLKYQIFSRNGSLIEFSEYLKNNLNLLELVQYGEKDREYFTLSDNFHLFKHVFKKYSKMTSLFIPFTFNFIPKDFISSWQLINITLFDVDNNPIKRLGLIVNRSLTKCNAILNFMIENNILEEFYQLCFDEIKNSQDSLDIQGIKKLNQFSQESESLKFSLDSDKDGENKNDDIPKNHEKNPEVDSNNIFLPSQFFFLCNNSQTEIIYDLFINPNETLKKFESDSKLLIDYRLQPFSSGELGLIEEHNKTYVAVVNKERPICDPFMAFFDFSNTSVAIMKLTLINKLKKIKKVLQYLDELGLSPTDLDNPNRIKFFTSTLNNYKPLKCFFFNMNTDEEMMSKFKINKQVYNILIELPTSQSSLYNSNINLLNSG